MRLKAIIQRRHSVRRYQLDKIVDRQIIDEIVKLAREAPSAGGIRAYQIIITQFKVTNQLDAPYYLVIFADLDRSAAKYGDRGKNLYAIQDATIVGAYIQLLAIDYGLSTCWIGAFRENRLKRQLGITNNLWPIAIIAIGYERT